MEKRPKIVCLGGGNGMPKAVLAGLKKEPVKISAVCAMLDTGGSSGRLKRDYGIRAPGDLRRALIALANTSPVVEELFDFRFQVGELEGHNFANLLITALELSTSDYGKTVDELKKLLHIEHQVFPVTLDRSEIRARLENGQLVRGERNIDRPKHNHELEIREVFLKPEVEAYPPAVEAIEKADLIVIGPGDLFSSLAQVLLVNNIPEAIRKSKGKTVYLVNLMNKKGETNGFSVSDFTRRVEEWIGRDLDKVLFNNFFPEEKRVERYKKDHPELLDLVRPAQPLDPRFIGKDLVFDQGLIEHDPSKVTPILLKMCNPRRPGAEIFSCRPFGPSP